MAEKKTGFLSRLEERYPIMTEEKGSICTMRGKKIHGCFGGPIVVNIGHGVPEILEAMMVQAKKVCFPYQGHLPAGRRLIWLMR